MRGLDAIRRLEAERAYLLRWFGGCGRELRGLSADTLTRVAFGLDPESEDRRRFDIPWDRGDLGRCERAFDAMPEHLQEVCAALLEAWQDALKDSRY